ncbi:hypothetical protein EB001_09395 [bacterium]|nr:hypothetical protein [bacterium]
MGMYDQSWCASCGAGMLYTEDENVTCYRCDQEEYNKLETRVSKLMEYIKVYVISLEQDSDRLEELKQNFSGDYDSEEYESLVLDDHYNTGELIAARHILSMARDIIAGQGKED